MTKIITIFRNIVQIVFHFCLLNILVNPRSHQNGYNVFGYFSKLIGQGEAARCFVDELIRNEEKFVLVDFFNTSHKQITPQEEEKYKKYYFKKLKYQSNIFFVDLLLLREVRKILPVIFKNKRNIVTFWWEFETGFEDRISILNKFDEVYVFSDFIKNTLDSIEKQTFKVTKINFPFVKNWIIENKPLTIKNNYNLEGKFCFFFNFDYLSSYDRKNPEAILRAIAEEFRNEKQVVFVVKTNNGKGFENKENSFAEKVNTLELSDQVVIIPETLSRNGFMTLLNAMDCYISLHRGEGLGLGILEALALNKPVIATNYGGNAEYMNNPLAFPVPYSLVPANDDYGQYKNVKQWADPDIEQAKKYMREVYTKYSSL